MQCIKMQYIISLSLIAGALAAPTSPLPSSTAAAAQLTSFFKQIFNSLDDNKNGHIEVVEMYKAFDDDDTNKDHNLSMDEFTAGNTTQRKFLEAVFKSMDSDHDGYISRQVTTTIFKMLDKNGDGLIDLNEFIDQYSKILSLILQDFEPPQGN
ncbi:calmodulin-4-like [Haliotis rubra]|uniref:calmodulin-4-like n=1 Tax=Haliotis rubra TaxID=36100 RepID=UPI001EE63052|nr:calmodulin-4-like [Haliotis rubra]